MRVRRQELRLGILQLQQVLLRSAPEHILYKVEELHADKNQLRAISQRASSLAGTTAGHVGHCNKALCSLRV